MTEFNWKEDLSVSAKRAMNLIFAGPTVHLANREVKGYTFDDNGEGGKEYFTSKDLREIGAGFIEVAAWLDKRAESGE